MAALTQGELQIQSVIPVMDIQHFHMEFRRNTHASFQAEGIVSEEDGDADILRSLTDTFVKVNADNRLLFAGMIEEVRMTQEGRGYHLTLKGVSATEQLDYRRKCRSFQDVSMTYREIMEQILADTPGAKLQFHVEDREIGSPVYQIEETDWEFIKRLASRLNTIIVPSAYSMTADIHIGLPDGGSSRADTDNTVVEQLWLDKRSSNICQRVRTDADWGVGDRINIGERDFFILEKECLLEKGLLQFYYTLAGKEAAWAERYENLYMTGLLLPATVLDVQEEQVRVKFDMDQEQTMEKAFWYPWRPDMGNFVYCMPEKGESVYIHIGEASGDEDRAVCGIHRNGSGNAEMKNTHRYFTTKNRKRMYLTPDTLGFQDMKQKKPLQIELKDHTGANIVSHRRLTVAAKDTIGLKGGNITIQAPKEISLVKRGVSPTVINMCNGFDTIGAADRVTMNGSGEDDFPVFHQSKEQAGMDYAWEKPEEVRRSIIGSTPVLGLKDNIGRVLEGCQVNCLGTCARNDTEITAIKER